MPLRLSALCLLLLASAPPVHADPPTAPADQPKPTRVLYIEGPPRWEFRRIRATLTGDKSIRFSAVLLSSDPDKMLDDDTALKHLPENAEQLGLFDVVLLGDVDLRLLAYSQVQLLADFVRKGGGLGVIAGSRFAPGGFRKTPLEDLLPVEIPAAPVTPPVPAPGQDAPAEPASFRLHLTDAGRQSPIFHFDANAAKSQQLIESELPAFFWYARGVSAKPGATVLAEHPTDRDAAGHPLPLLVTWKSGAGTVSFCGVDETWRWRSKGDVPFDTFWREQVRMLSTGRAQAP